MGTTINGIFIGGKRARREKALSYLQERIKKLKDSKRQDKSNIIIGDLTRMEKEAKILSDILSGKKKTVVNEKGELVKEESKEKWYIDIYQIHLGYVKNSERRKNKGKSRKKMKKVRSTSFVRSVIMQPGMMQAYRDGKMGISPKNHSFRARKEEPAYL